MSAPPATLAAVYVYYRVQGDPESATQAIQAMLQDVAARTGADARLLRRRDDAATWMEVYAPPGRIDAFLEALDACEARAGAAALAEGGRRHRECFVPLPAPAA